MRAPSLRLVSVDLLLAFDALFTERSVTRAAVRLSLSQPAASRALGRLRGLFDDPLFERQGAVLEPTPRARALHLRVQAALKAITGVVDTPLFDPSKLESPIRIAASDYGAVVVLPRFEKILSKAAPLAQLHILPWGEDTLIDLERGQLDLAIGVPGTINPRLRSEHLFSDDFSCLVRQRHPLCRATRSLKTYLAHPHVVISTGAGGAMIGPDDVLAAQGLVRRIGLRVPSWLSAALMVARSNLILTTPTQMARVLEAAAGLVRLTPPIDLPAVTYRQIWAVACDGDPANQWVREQMRACTAALR